MMNNQILYKTPNGEKAVMALYDAALSNWPIPYETFTKPTRHGETFIIASGNVLSPTMILLHGAGSNSTMWAHDVIDYSTRYRVYAIDLLGEAGKSAANRPSWEHDAFVEWLEDVMNALHITQSTFVGISQGAWTALKFAVKRPERVDQLVLLAPGGIVPDRKAFLIRAIGLTMLGRWGIRHLVRSLFGEQKIPQEVIERVVQISGQFKPRIGMLPIFTDEELKQLTMPILLLGGTKDIIRNLNKIEQRLSGIVPILTTYITAGAGHALVNTSVCVMEFLALTPERAKVEANDASPIPPMPYVGLLPTKR